MTTARRAARALPGHRILTAKAQGWDELSNGELLRAAEERGVDVLFTTDQRIRYQQNLTSRKIALVVLTGTTRWALVRLHLDAIAGTIDAATPGSYAEVYIPFE